MRVDLLVLILLLVSPFGLRTAWASPSRSTEIRVVLFGQPCTLNGPFDEATLKAIHSVSPEQIYPPSLSGNIAQVNSPEIKRALERLRKTATPIPAPLDRYRELLGKRLEQMIPFFEGLQALERTGSAKLLLSETKKNLSGKAARNFAKTAQQAAQAKKSKAVAKSDPSIEDRLFEIYDGAIEADPQEEFHRAIARMNISYVCSYDESDAH